MGMVVVNYAQIERLFSTYVRNPYPQNLEVAGNQHDCSPVDILAYPRMYNDGFLRRPVH
jgi:hypothetical protein